MAELFITEEEGWHSIIQGFNNANNSILVESLTLDDIDITDRTTIKIDTEGAEELVLRGASQTLRNPLVHTLIVEVTNNRYCARLLQEAGFDVKVLDVKGERNILSLDSETQVNLIARR